MDIEQIRPSHRNTNGYEVACLADCRMRVPDIGHASGFSWKDGVIYCEKGGEFKVMEKHDFARQFSVITWPQGLRLQPAAAEQEAARGVASSFSFVDKAAFVDADKLPDPTTTVHREPLPGDGTDEGDSPQDEVVDSANNAEGNAP